MILYRILGIGGVILGFVLFVIYQGLEGIRRWTK